jgi:hypothetical protein
MHIFGISEQFATILPLAIFDVAVLDKHFELSFLMVMTTDCYPKGFESQVRYGFFS